MTEFDRFLQERNEAFRKLDMEWARKNDPFLRVESDEVTLTALHKARYECTQIEDELRIESGRWLHERGFVRLFGLPLLPDGELPTDEEAKQFWEQFERRIGK